MALGGDAKCLPAEPLLELAPLPRLEQCERRVFGDERVSKSSRQWEENVRDLHVDQTFCDLRTGVAPFPVPSEAVAPSGRHCKLHDGILKQRAD